jgi:nicotinamidase-related amidase
MDHNDFLTERDKHVFPQSGFGARMGPGERPAVLVIDVTYNFCGPSREPIEVSVKRSRRSCGEEAWDAVDQIRKVLDAAQPLGVPVIYTAGIDFRLDGIDAGRWIDKNPGFLQDAADDEKRTDKRGNDIIDVIAPQPHDISLRKHKPSAFFGTILESLLTDLKVDTLLVCGTTTSGCIRATTIDGFSYNYRMQVVSDCVFDRGQASHHMNLFEMGMKYADIVDSDWVVDYLSTLKPREAAALR